MLTTPKENEEVILHFPALGGEYHTKLTCQPSKQSTRLTAGMHLSRGLVNTTKPKFKVIFPLNK